MTPAKIVSDFLAEHHVAREDVLRGKTHRFVRLRLLVIHRLRRVGYSKTEIARAIEKTRDGMSYWFAGDWKVYDTAVLRRPFVDGSGWNTDSDSVVIQICNKHKIYPAEFFGKGRDRRITEARREAIEKLSEAGFYDVGIASALKLNLSTVRYWTNEKYREYSRKKSRECLARSRQSELRA